MKAEDIALIIAGGIAVLLIAKGKAVAEEKPLPDYLVDRINKYWPIIEGEAKRFGVDPLLIVAVICTESEGVATAKAWEKKVGEHSMGLMQVLPSTARAMGYEGPDDGLLDPKTNIFYGTKYLAHQLHRYRNIPEAVAAYNAGSARYRAGRFINQRYVDKVLRYYEQAKRTPLGTRGVTREF